MSRPEGITDEHLIYLDNLRKSSKTNMFGAGEYIQKHFKISREEAKGILLYWMESFGREDR